LTFHVDESRDDIHHFHVGLLSDGPGLAGVESALRELVEEAWDRGACRYSAELHAYDIFNFEGDWTKSNAQHSIWVFDEALTLLTQHNVEVIARGAHLPTFRNRYGKAADPFPWNFSNLLERLNERLRARDEYGIVIADEQSEYRDALQRDLENARRYGTGGYRSQTLTRVLDTAHFVDSRLSRMTQLTDMVAYILRRRNGQREGDERVENSMRRWFELVYASIPQPNGQYYTIRH